MADRTLGWTNSTILIYFLLSFYKVLCAPSNDTNAAVSCIAAPILAPWNDCAAVLDKITESFGAPGKDRLVTWGRDVPHVDIYRNEIRLPYAFRLTRLDKKLKPNHCDIHIDNDIRQEGPPWANDSFTVMEMVASANQILDICYPRILTGKSFPTAQKNVYVTTLWIPFNELEEEQERASERVMWLKDSQLKSEEAHSANFASFVSR